MDDGETTLVLSGALRDDIKEMANISGISSEKLCRKAFALYKTCWNAVMNGKTIRICNSDGTPETNITGIK